MAYTVTVVIFTVLLVVFEVRYARAKHNNMNALYEFKRSAATIVALHKNNNQPKGQVPGGSP